VPLSEHTYAGSSMLWESFSMYMNRKLAVILIINFIFSISVPQTVLAHGEVELYARSAVLMDGDSGRILYGQDEDKPMPMASTTKIMTCIVALESMEEDTVCTVSENAASQPKVRLGMKKGDTFYLKDLLYSLMLESHNDAAVCIAETVGGNEREFAAKMNRKAEEIGCRDTYYITPNGLDGADAQGEHHTTARELAMVMRYCLTQSDKKERFLEITGTLSYSFTNIEGNKNFSCTNHNALLSILDGAVSGKTGFTGKAGYCYIGAVKRGDALLIVSLLACGWPNNKGYKWADTKRLIRYADDNFRKRKLAEESVKTSAVKVRGGSVQSVETHVDYGAEAPDTGNARSLLMRKEESVEMKTELVREIHAPVRKGETVGRVSYLVGDTVYAQYPIISSSFVPAWNYSVCLSDLTKKLLFSVSGKTYCK